MLNLGNYCYMTFLYKSLGSDCRDFLLVLKVHLYNIGCESIKSLLTDTFTCRIVHPSPGVPEDLIQEMFHRNNGMSREGLGLYISHKLVRIMNGTMEYVRGEDFSSFVIRLEFPLIQDVGHK